MQAHECVEPGPQVPRKTYHGGSNQDTALVTRACSPRLCAGRLQNCLQQWHVYTRRLQDGLTGRWDGCGEPRPPQHRLCVLTCQLFCPCRSGSLSCPPRIHHVRLPCVPSCPTLHVLSPSTLQKEHTAVKFPRAPLNIANRKLVGLSSFPSPSRACLFLAGPECLALSVVCGKTNG